eukprot:3682163-Alexandrium_andersonii.AAC.1
MSCRSSPTGPSSSTPERPDDPGSSPNRHRNRRDCNRMNLESQAGLVRRIFSGPRALRNPPIRSSA